MRSKPAPRRSLSPDPIHRDLSVSQLINRIMKDGKKTTASSLTYSAFEKIKNTTNQDPLSVFRQALENIRPQMEIRARRIGGAAYQVPTPVRPGRRDSLAIRWLILAARDRPSSQLHSFSDKLAAEIIDASHLTGNAVKKKQDTHRMAEANKAFAHFRW